MGFHDEWKAGKDKFEKATGKEKPSKTVLLLIKVHTGISSACKELDKHLAAEDSAKAKKALAEFGKVIKGYKPSAQKAAKSEGKVYKDAIDKLLRKLDKMEVAANNEVGVLCDQEEQTSGAFNSNYGSTPSSGTPFAQGFAIFLKCIKKSGLPLKELKGAGNFVNALEKFARQLEKLDQLRPAVLAGLEDQKKFDQKTHDDFVSTQNRATALVPSIVKLAGFYEDVGDKWRNDLMKTGRSNKDAIVALANEFAGYAGQVGPWASKNEALRPLPKSKSGLGYNVKFGSLPSITDKDRAKAWKQMVKCAETARLPVDEMKDAERFGKALGGWQIQLERTTDAREKALAVFADPKSDAEKAVKLFDGHRKQLMSLQGLVIRFARSCEAVASKWWNDLPSGMKVQQVPDAMTKFCSIVTSNSSVPAPLAQKESRKASGSTARDEEEPIYN